MFTSTSNDNCSVPLLKLIYMAPCNTYSNNDSPYTGRSNILQTWMNDLQSSYFLAVLCRAIQKFSFIVFIPIFQLVYTLTILRQISERRDYIDSPLCTFHNFWIITKYLHIDHLCQIMIIDWQWKHSIL